MLCACRAKHTTRSSAGMGILNFFLILGDRYSFITHNTTIHMSDITKAAILVWCITLNMST